MADERDRDVAVTEKMIEEGAAVVRKMASEWLGPFSERFLAEEVFLAMICASQPSQQPSAQTPEAE